MDVHLDNKINKSLIKIVKLYEWIVKYWNWYSCFKENVGKNQILTLIHMHTQVLKHKANEYATSHFRRTCMF